MSKRGRRNRSRADILAKRQSDDERRSHTKPAKIVKLDPPSPTLLYNPFKHVPRSPGGIILIQPKR